MFDPDKVALSERNTLKLKSAKRKKEICYKKVQSVANWTFVISSL